MWGSSCGTNFYNQFPFIELTEKLREGQQGHPPIYNKFPVFYDSSYIAKVDSFLQWLSIGLQPVIQHIDHIKIGGINQTTFELRCPNQNFAGTNDVNEAYSGGAQKWIYEGYTTEKVRLAYENIIQSHIEHFPNTLKIAAMIGGLNGWPCINDNGLICEPKDRPNITDRIIYHCTYLDNIGIQATALTENSGTPKSFVNSGLPLYYQLNFQQFNKSVTKEKFEAAILHGIAKNGVAIEVYSYQIEQHSNIIKKYL